jgi:hypothetical protein
MSDTLYDTDFYEWTQEQGRRLREAGSERINLPIDWENVAEEIESLGRSDLSAIRSHASRVIEHLLKLEFSPAAQPRADWEDSVANHRVEIEMAFKDSPSLRGRMSAVFPDCWRSARKLALRGLLRDGVAAADLPKRCPYTVEQVLDDDWFPKNRHGLG